jgi:hypothetical protein
MRSRSLQASLLTHALALAAGVALGWVGMPLWRQAVMAYHMADYGLLVEQCDTAMRDHYQAKRWLELAPSPDRVRELSSSELGLVVCQDYDLYQKRLQQWGLRESELAQMRLRAIEARATDLKEVVSIHEIRF